MRQRENLAICRRAGDCRSACRRGCHSVQPKIDTMIYCETPTLERWTAPPFDNVPGPTWTRLIANGTELSNSLERADWLTDPVQLTVCDICGQTSCGGTFARIVRLADQLLWLPVRSRDVDSGFHDSSFLRKGVLMPVATWEGLRENAPRLPPASHYAKATRNDIATLWLNEIPEKGRIRELRDIHTLMRSALASDPLDLEPATLSVSCLIDWLLAAPNEPADGHLVRTETCAAAVNSFYFDGFEWPSLLAGMEHSLVFGNEWAFVENPQPRNLAG